jgi:hypothetical protein
LPVEVSELLRNRRPRCGTLALMAEPARIGWAVVGEIEFVEGERLLVAHVWCSGCLATRPLALSRLWIRWVRRWGIAVFVEL